MPKQARPRKLLKNFRVSEAIWERVETAATEEDVNPSEIVRIALRDWLDRRR